MLEDLEPVGLTTAARRIGCDPFEVIRLLVAAGAVPEGSLVIDAELVDKLRGIGRIEPPWWEGVALPQDNNPARARVRAAVQLLLERGRIGDDRTRMDNVWRGLPPSDRRLLERALSAFSHEGIVRISPSAIGPLISIEPVAVEAAKKFVAGKLDSPGLRALLAEV
jgi:hypothetical protein